MRVETIGNETLHLVDCREFSMAQEIEQLRAAVCDLKRLICIDGAELRNLCAARDEARRERDALKARINESPTALAQREHYGGCVLYGPEELDGKRVALVQLGG